jgi:hypothetical protein
LLFLELFVQFASLALQEALAHLQLPDFLIFDHSLDRVLAALKAEFQIRTAQRVLELGDGSQRLSRLQQQRAETRPALARTYILHLIAVIYI